MAAGRPSQYLEFATPPPGVPGPPSQAVALFPAVQRRRIRDARFLGLPLPAWIIVAGVSLVVIIVALAILPRIGGKSPVEAAPGGGGGGVGEGGGSSAAGTTAGLGASTSPSTGASAQPGSGGDPPPALAVTDVSAVPQVIRMKISITISNPASVDQDWRSVSVQVSDGLAPLLQAITPGTRVYDVGRTVCVEPTTDATIAAGGSMLVEFTVNTVLARPPRKQDTQVDNPVCIAPSEG